MSAQPRVFLDAFLTPLARHLTRADVTDLYINRPHEIWLQTAEGTERHEAPALDDAALWRLARQIAAASDQGISREHPLLAATLPDGARVQVCAPPATRGHVAVAIRKHVVPDLTLADYVTAGAFDRVGEGALTRRAETDILRALLDARDIRGFLAAAVRAKRTILIAGGTATGKTTLLNALLKEAPADERIVLIEDTPEVQITQPNAIGLVAVRGRLGEATVSATDLLEATLRLRPDRIILGEIRGPEALAFMRAINTGHPGSITTVHANSAEGAIQQLAMIATQSGATPEQAQLERYIRSVVEITVVLVRVDGRPTVSEIQLSDAA